MIKKNKDIVLSPDVEQILNILVEDFRNRLLQEVENLAETQKKDSEEVTASDILKSASRYQEDRSRRVSNQVQLIFDLTRALGVILLIVGIAYFLYNYFDIYLSYEEEAALQISVVGLLFIGMSFLTRRLFYTLKQSKIDRPVFLDFSLSFVKRWQGLETAIRESAEKNLGITSEREPISFLINKMRHAELLNPEDERIIKQLVDLRNQIVHEGYVMDYREFEHAINETSRFINKLSGFN